MTSALQRYVESVISEEVIASIVERVRRGNYYEVAAGSVGVPLRTFNRWRARGTQLQHKKNLKELFDKGELSSFDQLCVTLVIELEQAELDNEARLVESWEAAGQTDWKAAKELLARRHRERWTDPERLVVGDEEGNVPIVISITRRPEDGAGQPTSKELARSGKTSTLKGTRTADRKRGK